MHVLLLLLLFVLTVEDRVKEALVQLRSGESQAAICFFFLDCHDGSSEVSILRVILVVVVCGQAVSVVRLSPMPMGGGSDCIVFDADIQRGSSTQLQRWPSCCHQQQTQTQKEGSTAGALQRVQ
jgi:hypothetical protein